MTGMEKKNWLNMLFGKRTEEDADRSPYLVVGLGNPGIEFRNSRHNVGFMVIDRLAQKYNLKIAKYQFKALVGTASIDEKKVFLAKPQTFMNLSGIAVGSLIKYYKIPLQNLLVVHDDVDLPFGTLRIRPKGGSAGQKGIESVIGRLGSQNFPRLRVGIGRPAGRKATSSYVLENFLGTEIKMLDPLLSQAADAVVSFIQHGLNTSMNLFNGDQFKE